MKAIRNSMLSLFLTSLTFTALHAQNVQIDSTNSTPVSCATGADGTITVYVSGGIPPYSYALSRGVTPVESGGPTMADSYTFSGHDKYPSYFIIVSDSDPGSGDVFTVISINGPDPIEVDSWSHTDITCNNANDGSITVSATGEGGNYIFTLNGPVTEANEFGIFTALPGGNYTVTVTDRDACPTSDVTPAISIINPDPVSVNLEQITDAGCFGEASGAISITPSGGTPSGTGSGYTYAWTGPDFSSTQEDISGLKAGDYFVTVFDVNVCSTIEGPYTVGQPSQIAVSLQSFSPVRCNGGADGSADISTSGGAGGYNWSWVGQVNGLVSNLEDPVNLPADSYDLQVDDADGCSESFPDFLTISEPLPLDLELNGSSAVSCNGGNDGSAQITASGGTPDYSYLWTGASGGYTTTEEDPISLPADTYSVNITDANGCTQLFPNVVTITEPTAISMSLLGSSDVSCNGGNDGSAQIQVSGGTGPYTFEWTGSNPVHQSTTQNPDDLYADTYSLIITDNNGCPDIHPDLLTISEPAPLSVGIDLVENIDCFGDSTGSIGITPGGGTASYSYAWSGPGGFSAFQEDISNLPAGTYSLFLTDGQGCTQDFPDLVTLTQNPAITASFTPLDLTCGPPLPSNDGSIEATVSGGFPTYSYSWSGPGSFSSGDEDISNLLPGSYVLEVRDGLGCVQSLPPVEIQSPPELTATAAASDIVCNGAGNGSIDLEVSGGTPDYSYLWSGPDAYIQNTEDISNLEAGTYSVQVTDNNSCVVNFPDIAMVGEPDPILVSVDVNDISCAGAGDGSVDLTISGGIPPYAVIWDGPPSFSSGSEDLSNLEAGVYNLSVRDANLCTEAFPGLVTINEPTPINVNLVSQQDILCHGDLNGSADIEVSGGNPPYTFAWTDSLGQLVSDLEDPLGLGAGRYSLEVSDQNSCSELYPDLLVLADVPALSMDLSKTDILCYGDGDGIITATALGGTAPYEYSRIGDIDGTYQSDNSFAPLAPGLYTIWVRDANLCVFSDTISVRQPPELQIQGESSSSNNLCFGDSLGVISIDLVTGGVTPYAYSIDDGNTFFSDPLFSGLPAGNYQTVVQDANGCPVRGNLNVISQPSPLLIDYYQQWDITTCSYAEEGRAVIIGIGGSGSISYSLDSAVSVPSGDFRDLEAGGHSLRIIDQNLCVKDTNIVIQAPDPLVYTSVDLTHINGCPGELAGAVSFSGSGGTGTIRYSIDSEAFQPTGSFNALAAGPHTLHLIDDNDCTLDSIIELTEPDPIAITQELSEAVTCHGADNGRIEVTASGGNGPLTYTLEPGSLLSSDGRFDLLGPGTYTVFVNDSAGCGPLPSGVLEISEPPALNLDSLRSRNIDCYGQADGMLEIFVSGGVPPYQFSIDDQASWSNDSLFSTLGPGDYEIWVMDANLCLLPVGSITLTEAPALSMSLSLTHIEACAGDATGIIEAQGSGGSGQLSYSLDGSIFQDSGTFTTLTAGPYEITLRDELGCTLLVQDTILEPDSLKAVYTHTDATLGNTGSISITNVSGGTPPYSYSIQGYSGPFGPETTYTDLDPGPYLVVTMDQAGCTFEAMIWILDSPPLDVVVNVSDVACHGESNGSIEFVPQDAEGEVEYSINNGLSFESIALFSDLPGDSTYLLVARDAAGKVFTASVFIAEPEALTLDFLVTPAQCNSFSESGSIDITVSGGTGTYTYSWSDGSTSEDRSAIGAGSYKLEVLDGNNCSITDSMEVFSLVQVEAYAGRDTTICYGDSIQLEGAGDQNPLWSPSGLLSEADILNPLTRSITRDTFFVLTMTETFSGYDCYQTDTVRISLYPPTGLEARPDTLILAGNSVRLYTLGGSFSSYRWEPSTWLDDPSLADPMATPEQAIRYYVFATNIYGCEEKDSTFIDVIENLVIYNVFTPNGDGVNDYFEIDNSEQFPDMQVEIYNRWGDLLYSEKGYDAASRWDGSARGKDAPLGTYYYVIIPYPGAKAITGHVTIIR